MTDTTNYYVCTKCGKACDVLPPRHLSLSVCCKAPVRVHSAKD